MDEYVCAVCGADMKALKSRLVALMRDDPIKAKEELSIWAGPQSGRLRRLWLLRRGRWWNEMACDQRTKFLQSRLIPEGFHLLFPEPVLTHVVHSNWENLNRGMRKELTRLQLVQERP